MSASTDDARRELGELQAQLERLSRVWPELLPELTQRRERYTKAAIDHGSELDRGKVKAIEELIDLPETIKRKMERLMNDINFAESRQQPIGESIL